MENKIYIHIHIPKTAGCFIRNLYEKSPNNKMFYPFNYIETKDFNGNGQVFSEVMKYHYNISFLEQNIPSIKSSKIKLFSVVRNPYDRIYSLWKYCKKEGVIGSVNIFKVSDSFNQFVYELCNDMYLGYYISQSQLFYLKGMEKYDIKIFKFEEMEKLKKFLINNCNLTWSDEKINSTSGLYYKEAYTPELIKMVKEKFIQEFEVFGYSTFL